MKVTVLAMCALVAAAIATAALRGGDGVESNWTVVSGNATVTGASGKVCYSDRDPDAAVPPWVVGQSAQTALANLRKAGFHASVFPPEYAPSSVVVRQIPLRGWRWCKWISIQLRVASG